MSEKIYIGVDLGGTTVKLGICTEEGELLHKFEGPTDAEQGPETVLNRINEYSRALVGNSSFSWDQVAGVGAGIPGFMDIAEGFVKLSPNFPGFVNVPVKKGLEERFGKPVKINNDANVAVLGEAWAGAGKGVSTLVCYTLGTGVGGGVIVDGRLCTGFAGMAGELGHMQIVPDLEAIQCGCGQYGCLETVSSATGIIRMATDAVERGDSTTLTELGSITAKDVFDAAKAGDEVACRIVNRAAYYLGRAMAAVAVVINPQRFIVGGGVSAAGDVLLDPVREVFKKYTTNKANEGVEIVRAQLGNSAGVVGAAGLMLRG
ncbi:ROK family glucokinase [Paenibacillus sp. y28]|uniref:ROK family glucokinase n=1 Tax=Paenibacillus sp. y28 TaxID=3129110 RepID=UPI0030185B91